MDTPSDSVGAVDDLSPYLDSEMEGQCKMADGRSWRMAVGIALVIGRGDAGCSVHMARVQRSDVLVLVDGRQRRGGSMLTVVTVGHDSRSRGKKPCRNARSQEIGAPVGGCLSRHGRR